MICLSYVLVVLDDDLRTSEGLLRACAASVGSTCSMRESAVKNIIVATFIIYSVFIIHQLFAVKKEEWCGRRYAVSIGTVGCILCMILVGVWCLLSGVSCIFTSHHAWFCCL